MFERLDSRSDVLTQVLEAVHLGSVLSSRSELRAPWALHYGMTEHRAGFHVVAEGRCWVTVDDVGEPVELAAGDMIVFPHGTGHTLGDAPTTPSVELEDCVAGIAPGERRALSSGGNGDQTILLCGSYGFAADGANPLLRGLPHMLHLSARQMRDGPMAAAIQLLSAEAGGPNPGTSLVVDRLVDLLFIYALRIWLEEHGAARSSTWFGALQDPIIGPAVRAVHDNPSHAWTVSALARHSGLSRAAFARRFREAIGEPPLAYVTRWRMTTAAELLTQGEFISAVAQRVGYDNEFAFAKAFKRVRGIAPGQHRRRHQA